MPHLTKDTNVVENQFGEEIEIRLLPKWGANYRIDAIKLTHKPNGEKFRFLRVAIIGTNTAIGEMNERMGTLQYTFIHLPSRAKIQKVRVVKGRERRDGSRAVVLVLHYLDRSGTEREHEEIMDVPRR